MWLLVAPAKYFACQRSFICLSDERKQRVWILVAQGLFCAMDEMKQWSSFLVALVARFLSSLKIFHGPYCPTPLKYKCSASLLDLPLVKSKNSIMLRKIVLCFYFDIITKCAIECDCTIAENQWFKKLFWL